MQFDRHLPTMGDEEPFFITRNGAIWLASLSGKPAINLGSEAEILSAMRLFVAEQGSGLAATPTADSAPPTPPTSTPSPPPPMQTPAPASREKPLRASERHELTILGKLYTGMGSRDVTILDLSETGCHFHDRFSHLEADARVTVKIGPIGPVAATVKWRRQEHVGLQFDTPLYPAVLEHILGHFDLRKT